MSRKEVKKNTIALDEKFRRVLNPFTNKKEDIPELDPKWKEDINFVSFTSIPIAVDPETHDITCKDQASLEEWKERATFIDQDLHNLLSLSHSQFWCQAIFDESLHQCIDSYLKQVTRPFDLLHLKLPEELSCLKQNVYRRMFMVLLRMSTHKETKEDFFNPEVFGEVLYNNYLFDIPKLMDICAIYGGENSENISLLRKMVENIFDKQPRYFDDLDETIPSLLATLDNILTKCGIEDPDDDSLQKLTTNITSKDLELSELSDIILYLYDISKTIKNFMETFPPSCSYFIKHGVVCRIAVCFEMIMPFLERQVKSYKLLRTYLQHTMRSMCEVCSVAIKLSCIDALPKSAQNPEALQNCVENYVQVLSTTLSEKRFLSFYDSHFSIEDDLITIQSYQSSSLDSTRIEYIIDAVHNARETFPLKKPTTNRAKNHVQVEINGLTEKPCTSGFKSDENPCSRGLTPNKDNVQETKSQEEPAAPLVRHDVDPVQLDSMVMSVRDLLPDLGDGFVIMCLEEFNYDIERVINSLLENKLTDNLNKLDRKMTKAQAVSSRNEAKTIISTRHSVFDKDEFDVFTGGTKIDLSRIHKGKKRDVTTLKTLLADKDHMTDSMKERYNQYDVYGQINKTDVFDEYNDEYDDTYDSLDVGAQDDDSADELTSRRPFTVPRILGIPEDLNESDDDTEDAEKNPPEETSSGQQTKWRTPDKRPNHKGFYTEGYNNRGRGQQPMKTESSAGSKGNKTKSKGKVPADAATLKQRAFNERHKNQRANHNRKAGAEWKRNKGMGALPKQ